MILKLYETNRDTQGSALMFYRKPCLFFQSFQLKYKMHLFVVFNFTCCQAKLINTRRYPNMTHSRIENTTIQTGIRLN